MNFSWRPGGYQSFYIREPKRRCISAAPFRDRVVHHALCNIIEPRFEDLFSPNSYANRKGMGTHRAIDHLQKLAKSYPYVLRADVVQHFPSIDHSLLLHTLKRKISEPEIIWLITQLINSGRGLLDQEYDMVHFAADDLLAIFRPRGLPIGNLTSQFWSNCYLHTFDQFVERELGVGGYARYVDDLAFFSNSKPQLWEWKRRIIERLSALRLTIHENCAQVSSVREGIPWLGFIVYPGYRKIKSRKVRHATKSLRSMYQSCALGDKSWQQMSARVKAWISHADYADGDGIKPAVLSRVTRKKR